MFQVLKVAGSTLQVIIISLVTIGLAGCGGGGGGSSPAAPPVAVNPPTPEPTGPDFSDLDNSFQAFIDSDPVFDGISYVLVSSEGVMHTAVFGDHTSSSSSPLKAMISTP